MEHEASFLTHATFDEKWRQTAIGRYFRNIRTIILIILTLSAAGLATFFSLPRELNPSIEIPIVMVSTIYPGASPEDIENLVTIPLEDAVSGLSDTTSVTSSSQAGSSFITLEFASNVDPDKAKADVQSAVDSVSGLPEDAETPSVQKMDFEHQPALVFAVSGADPATLRNFTDVLEERLKDLPEIESVDLANNQPQEVVVSLLPELLSRYQLDPRTVSDSVSAALGSFPGGSLSSDHNTFSLAVDRQALSVEDLRNTPLRLNDTPLRLGQIATIEERGANNTSSALYATPDVAPQKAVTFSVFKTDSADTQAAVTAANDVFQKTNEEHGNHFTQSVTFDSGKEISKSFFQLFRDFSITVGLVFLVLILFFGLRQSIVASLAIPLTFLITFLIMGSADISINFISLFSLLLALGILVDNAIVIISAMANYERTRRFTPDESALFVWNDFRGVILTTTITTVWAFLPLLLASGIIGEFIRPIPIVVSSALAISAAVALFIVIPMMAMLQNGNFPRRVISFLYTLVFLLGAGLLFLLIPAGPYRIALFALALAALTGLGWSIRLVRREKRETAVSRPFLSANVRRLTDEGLFDFHPISLRYEKLIKRIIGEKRLRRRVLAGLIIFMLFSYSLVPLGLVVNEFFPSEDNELVSVSVELPTGTPRDQSALEASGLLESLRKESGVHFGLAELGAASLDGSFSGGSSNKILITLLLVPEGDRDFSSGEFITRLNREYADYSSGKFSAAQASGGPPAGADLQIKLLGEDLPTLENYGARVAAYLKDQPGTSNVSLSIEGGSSKIVFVPANEKIQAAGLSESDVASWLRTLGSGSIIKKDALFENDKQDVVIRFGSSDSLASAEDLGRLSIPTPQGLIPLANLGSFVLKPNPTLITREDGKRTLSITASVDDGYSVTTENAALEKFADGELDLPQGYAWKTGGVNDENNKSIQSILQAMLLSAILIFATMVVQFNSLRKALIVLLVIPIAVSGVFIIFGLIGIPLSFPALIGILALFGIVVNNSIIMVDKINKNMDAGLPLDRAVSEGAASRLEPILLTALTTIVGLIPITLSDPIWQGLGGAIIAGLLFSGIAKLFFIPIAYKAFFGGKDSEDAVV